MKSKEFKQAVEFIQKRQSRFLKENFSVVFDGIELRRHIQFPTEKEVIPKLYFIEFNDTVADLPLKFSGYFFAQVPSAIRPLELNGVQIRLRGVGIGGYDSTFLKYYKEIETIRSKWVSGEIFVDEGLEPALNIDRDSFNEHDEHFKKLQSFIHDKLDKLFREINLSARELSWEKREQKNKNLRRNMQKIVAEQSKGKFKLMQRDLEESAPIVDVNKDTGEIIVNTASRPLRKKRADMIIQYVELAYCIAEQMAKTEKGRHEIFYRLVKQILRELV